MNVNRHTVELWCRKYRNRTDEQIIMDILSVAEGRGRKEGITGEEKTWRTSALTKHINVAAKEVGFDRLSTITESGVYKILDKTNIKPFRIQYYCGRKDSDFYEKMHNVQLVYKQLSLQFSEDGNLISFEDVKVQTLIT